MTWKEEFLRVDFDGVPMIGASFGGVSFYVLDSERTGGRRVVEDDIPYSDEGFTDDLGLKRRRVRLTGYVIGDDYIQRRDDLIDACEAALGDGGEAHELIHPTSGRLQMLCENYTCSERSNAGGRADFALTFVSPKSGGLAFEKIQSVEVATLSAKRVLGGEYLQIATANQVESDFLTPIENAIEKFADTVREPFAALLEDANDAAAFRSRIDSLVENAASIVTDPALILFSVGEVLDAGFQPPRVPGDVLLLASKVEQLWNEIKSIFEPSPYATETRAKQAILVDATAEFLACSVALVVADVGAGAAYEDYESALEARNGLGAMLDTRAQTPGFETTQTEIDNVRAGVLGRVPRNERGQFRRQIFTPAVTTASVLLAYRFYGSTARELEFCARNKIPNPGFVQGDQPVEVLRR